MSELKKLETTGYSSKLDEIAKNDTEVFLKVKLSGRRTFGEYEFEPKNGFAVKFGNHIDVLNLDKCDVYQLEQPQLNENQQIVLEWLKNIFNSPIIINPIAVVFALHNELVKDNEIDAVEAYEEMGFEEEIQVLQAFIQWALEQEEE
ncbi:hypothetical protein ABRY77_16205 [Enterococcus casseliflavus]|uniref:hypothetical protein n=1 Tax=Enterococcus casseliflavus TaxID=37734 RepID=UPI003EE00EF3